MKQTFIESLSVCSCLNKPDTIKKKKQAQLTTAGRRATSFLLSSVETVPGLFVSDPLHSEQVYYFHLQRFIFDDEALFWDLHALPCAHMGRAASVRADMTLVQSGIAVNEGHRSPLH